MEGSKNRTPVNAAILIKAVNKNDDCQENRSDIKVAKGTPRTVANVSPEKMMLTALDLSEGSDVMPATDKAIDQ